jgi:hypothetical protein
MVRLDLEARRQADNRLMPSPREQLTKQWFGLNLFSMEAPASHLSNARDPQACIWVIAAGAH